MSSERLQLSDGAVTIRQVGLDQLDQVYEALVHWATVLRVDGFRLWPL